MQNTVSKLGPFKTLEMKMEDTKILDGPSLSLLGGSRELEIYTPTREPAQESC